VKAKGSGTNHHDLAFESACHRAVLHQISDTNKKCPPALG
jgi:hypothetical protein